MEMVAADKGAKTGQNDDYLNLVINRYDDIWMDNGAIYLHRLLRPLKSVKTEIVEDQITIEILDIEGFKDEFPEMIQKVRKSMIVKEKEKTGIYVEKKKDFIIIQERSKINGKVDLKEDVFNSKKTREVTNRLIEGLEAGEKTCILCGKTFQKRYKKLQQASYPFVTKIASLNGIRSTYKNGQISLKEYYEDFCPLCYLIGVLEWGDDAKIYRTFIGEKYALIFLPEAREFKTLYKFKKEIAESTIMNNSLRYSNIPLKEDHQRPENTPGIYSTLLKFYEVWLEAEHEISPLIWHVIKIPLGAVKNIKIEKAEIRDKTIKLIQNMFEKDIYIYTELIKSIYIFPVEGKKTKNIFQNEAEMREKLSIAIIKDDLHFFTQQFLPTKNQNIVLKNEMKTYLDELIYEWRLKKMNLPKDKLNDIKKFGNIVAKIHPKNPSLLHKLDRARNEKEFWSVLREISKRLTLLEKKDLMMTTPGSVDEVIKIIKEDGSKWEEMRDLIVMYASMYIAKSKLARGD